MFEVFATEEDKEGEPQMSYSDFLDCLTPYNQGELMQREAIDTYVKDHTPAVMKYADSNCDGFISFTEFIFFLTIYQAPAGAMRRIFKKYDNKLTKEQFAEEVSKLRHKTLSKSVNESKLDGRKVKTDDEEIAETNKRITELIAGKNDHITFEAFQSLRK